MKILILKPSSLGDVIHALPVLRLLKRHWPEAQIYWWLATELLPLLEGDRDLTGIIPFARKRWKTPADLTGYLKRVLEARSRKFDLVIDLQGLARSGLFGWLANGGLTVGLDIQREGARGFHDISLGRPGTDTHAVDWYLALLEKIGVPVDAPYEWLPVREPVATEVRRKLNLEGRRWAVINPGARWMNKRWPAGHYARLVHLLGAEHPDLNFIVTGAKSERDLGSVICGELPGRTLNLAGETTLQEMIELVRGAAVMVTNDTGPMHVAVAVKTPVVTMFGPTNHQRTGPYRQLEQVLRHPLPCAPCMKSQCYFHQPMECLVAITPQTVHAEVNRMLAGKKGG